MTRIGEPVRTTIATPEPVRIPYRREVRPRDPADVPLPGRIPLNPAPTPAHGFREEQLPYIRLTEDEEQPFVERMLRC